MQEQQGPIIVRPVHAGEQQPSPLLPRRLAPGAKHMPMGVSANTVGVAHSIRLAKIRRLLFLGVPVIILLAVVAGVWLAARNLSQLDHKAIRNGAYDYNFDFYKAAEPVNLLQGQGLRLDKRAIAIAAPTTDAIILDCSSLGREWKEAFEVYIEGEKRPVCSESDKSFLAIFPHGTQPHLFKVSYTSAQRDEQGRKDIETIFSSIKVSNVQ